MMSQENNLTRKQTARLLTWVGVWPEIDVPYKRLMPALTGDFADVVAMRCLRRLPPHRLQHTWEISDEPWSIHISHSINYYNGKDPADAIFTAVLAYLKEQGEGK